MPRGGCSCSKLVQITRPTNCRHKWPTAGGSRTHPTGASPPSRTHRADRSTPGAAGSSAAAAIALRGHPRDYDGWAELGNPGWSFDDILPYFRRLESDADFRTPHHDGEGPVRRYGPDELTPLNAAFLDAAQALGYTRVEDHNQPGAVGVGLLPTNTRRDGLRMSCALT
jgi:choline dehydrogenase